MRSKKAGDGAATFGPAQTAPSSSSWIEKTPGVVGGDARIRKTRATVWGLVEWRKLGLSDSEILVRNPGLTPDDLEAAWNYYALNQDEIDQAIQQNAEA
jgi:type III restriction enzyme